MKENKTFIVVDEYQNLMKLKPPLMTKDQWIAELHKLFKKFV